MAAADDANVAVDQSKSEVDLLHESIAAKREKLAEFEAKRQSALVDHAGDLELLSLMTEDARLDAQVAQAELAAHPDTIAAGNADNLEAAKRALANAGGVKYEAEPAAVDVPEKTTPAQSNPPAVSPPAPPVTSPATSLNLGAPAPTEEGK